MKKIIFYSLLVAGISLASCLSKSNQVQAQAQMKAASGCSSACSAGTAAKKNAQVNENKESAGVYYFHGDRRCTTCKAVGKTAQEVAAKLQVPFYDINFDQPENKAIAKEFNASTSALFIKHNKSGKVDDLTNFAFRNALRNTEAYVAKLEATIKAE
ncbi:nitrophenyl compound nitroreductase subunit ArsF family protein [Ancylomarina longa]|uniref:Thioredoxin n=1 Tax=Ancylomarina longa TaxID=2487017 RepID=A0A434AVU9_9BACT|nr:nitrophenyl compound nitroreductase subunit ArsF family protein [Ancylomarina longa]RUT78599.1 hypothetical protein DLK05_07100 [Ancylomarina longa]